MIEKEVTKKRLVWGTTVVTFFLLYTTVEILIALEMGKKGWFLFLHHWLYAVASMLFLLLVDYLAIRALIIDYIDFFFPCKRRGHTPGLPGFPKPKQYGMITMYPMGPLVRVCYRCGKEIEWSDNHG